MLNSLWNWVWLQVRPVAVKEFIHMLNNPATINIAIMLPLIQIMIFGFAINMDVKDIPTAVYDEDRRSSANDITTSMQNTTYFKINDHVYSKEDVIKRIRKGSSQVGVVVPPDYSDNVARGQNAKFQVLIDGSDSNTATQGLATVNQLSTILSQNELAKQARGSIETPSRIEVVPHVLYNPDLKTTFLTIPGLLGIVLLNVVLFLTTFSLAKERESGTMDMLLVTPLQPSGLIVGKIVPYVGLGFLDFNLVLGAMFFIFHVPIRGSIFLLEFAAFLFLLSVLGLGLLISSRSSNQMQAAQIAQLIVLPSIMLSGFVFSINAMPKWIQGLSYLIPMTYFIQILRGVIIRGATLTDLSHQLLMLLTLGGVILGISIVSFKRRMG